MTKTTPKDGMHAFFAYARQRQLGRIMKEADPAWVQPDEILREYSFCNVFREDDKTTRWLAKHVRGPMDKARDPRLMLAVVLFRMFNRIESGEAMFCDDNLLGNSSAFDSYWRTGETKWLKRAMIARQGKKGPFVTGSYIIAGPGGMSKLDGMLKVVDKFRRGAGTWRDEDCGWQDVSDRLAKGGRTSLEELHAYLREFDYFGTFHAYEIVTDLRWTHLLRRATDIYTWASPGPGCKRGLNRVFGRDKDARPWGSKESLLEEMDEILDESTRASQWTNFVHKMRDRFPKIKTPLEWEMRDVEHTLCEFDKYERTRLGEGRPRGKYHGYAAAR